MPEIELYDIEGRRLYLTQDVRRIFYEADLQECQSELSLVEIGHHVGVSSTNP